MQTEKIRILHLVDGLVLGGAEVMITQIIEALGKEKYDHFVYYFDNDGPIRQKLETKGTPVYKGINRASIRKPTKFLVTLFYLIRDLILFIRSKRIQIIQSHMRPANQLAVAVGRLTRTPTFPTIHTPLAFVDQRNMRDMRLLLRKAANQIAYRLADKVVVVSQEISEKVKQCFSLEENKVLLLKNGIVMENQYIGSNVSGEFFRGSENKFKIIAVGRLVPLKNFDVLIRAIGEVVKRDLKNLLVLITGEGEERLHLKALINELGLENYVKLIGLRHNIIELLKASDLFVMSSSYEGLSISMIEAMACGLPIIASDIRGFTDYITHGQNGLIFPVGDHEALSDCILNLYKDDRLRVKLAHAARKTFVKEYDMRKNILLLDTLFQSYCNKT